MFSMLVFAAVLFSAPGDELDAPAPPPSKDTTDPSVLEAHLVRRTDTTKLRIESGDSVFITTEAAFPAARGAKLIPPKSVGFTTWSPAEQIGFSVDVVLGTMRLENRTFRVPVTYRLSVGVGAATGARSFTGQLELRLPNVKKPILSELIPHELEIVAPEATPAEIELDRRADLYFRARGREAKNSDESIQMVSLANIASTRLHALAESDDPASSDLAILALGANAPPPRKVAFEREHVVERALNDARKALFELDITTAEEQLLSLRPSGRLSLSALADTLIMLGAVHAARGRAKEAEASFARALCIDPSNTAKLDHHLFDAAFAYAKERGSACKTKTEILDTGAVRTEAALIVRATVGPDPHGLVTGGDIELWGPGGAVQASMKVRAKDGVLEAHFVDPGEVENIEGKLLLRVLAKDISGVVIAAYGDPDPRATTIRGVDRNEGGVPWWVWVAGGAAVVGGGIAVAIAASSDTEVNRGIGPFHAEF